MTLLDTLRTSRAQHGADALALRCRDAADEIERLRRENDALRNRMCAGLTPLDAFYFLRALDQTSLQRTSDEVV